MMRK
jgi:hypothetical protein